MQWEIVWWCEKLTVKNVNVCIFITKCIDNCLVHSSCTRKWSLALPSAGLGIVHYPRRNSEE